MHRMFALRVIVATLAVALFVVAEPVAAQFDALSGLGGEPARPPLTPITVKAVIAPAADGQPVRLVVTADIIPGWNTYSITQPAGGQVRTKIKVNPSPQFTVGEFQTVEAPTIHPEPAFNNLLVEEHRGSVTWFAPLQLAAGVDPAVLEITGNVFAQACEKTCLPPKDHPFTAKLGTPPVKLPAVQAAPAPPLPPKTEAVPSPLAPNLAVPAIPPPPPNVAASPMVESRGTYAPLQSHLTWNGRVEPGNVASGGKTRLLFTAVMEPKWHIYDIDKPQIFGNQSTLLFVTFGSPGLKFGQPIADRKPTPPQGTASSPNSRLLPYYEDQVTWSLEVETPPDAKPGQTQTVQGMLGFQTCNENTLCDRPQSIHFDATWTVAANGEAAVPQAIRFYDPQSYATAARLEGGGNVTTSPPPPEGPFTPSMGASGYDIGLISVQSQEGSSPLVVMLATGLLAGFILNFMPCVLPVIGLKVLSFVEQGGHDRRRVLLLNVWYSLGIVSVFWLLAAISVVLRIWFGTQYGWGQQFSYDAFNIGLVAVVFVMALSFLGVWEIPIPGFAGSKNAQQMASKEGAVGAFIKGMITTVLATPCSGPFLGTAVAFALISSPAVTFAMFTAMGLGMAAPYLLIGFQPSLIKFLPKPGEWMDTFKQLMGFVLIGTVLWLMLPIDAGLLMPTLVLLAGLSGACWWIGRTPGYAELPQKLKAWAQGSAFAAVIGWLAFAMPQVTDPLPWKHFAMADFVHQVNSGKTVLVEFTADWCATCKTLKAANLDRSRTKERVLKNGVVVYEVNIDDTSPEEKAFFLRMQPSGGVPLVAIFPAGKKYEPIHFGDGYTQSQILTALDQAGPSKPTNDVAGRDNATSGLR